MSAIAPEKSLPPRLLGAEAIGVLLHKTTATVWCDLSRAPERLPPPIRIPGTRKALWLESAVLAWLQERQVQAKPQRGRPTKRQQIDRATSAAAQKAMAKKEQA